MMADYYISTSGGIGTGSIGDPWAFEYALTQAAAGDNLYMRAGRYEGPYTMPTNSGADGSPITVQPYQSEQVTMGAASGTGSTTWTLDRGTPCEYWTIKGLEFNGVSEYPNATVSKFFQFTGCNHWIIEDCSFRYASFAGIMMSGRANNHMIVRRCSFLDCGRWDDGAGSGPFGNGCQIGELSAYGLIEDCTAERCGHSPLRLRGNYCVMRGCHVTGSYGIANFTDRWIKPGMRIGTRCIQIEGLGHVVENNTFVDAGTSRTTQKINSVQWRAGEGVFRNNVLSRGYAAGVFTDSSPEAARFGHSDSCFYNNTFYDFNGASFQSSGEHSGDIAHIPKRERVKNNIIHKSRQLLVLPGDGSMANPDADISYGSKTAAGLGPFGGAQITANMVYYDGSGTTATPGAMVRYPFPDDATLVIDSLADAEAAHPTEIFYNREEEVQFQTANPQVLADFPLASGSLGVRDSAPLTRVITYGNPSTTMVVEDSRYFTDGNQIIPGDKIMTRWGVSQIVSIDHSTNTITLAEGITMREGDPLYLANERHMGGAGSSYVPTPNVQGLQLEGERSNVSLSTRIVGNESYWTHSSATSEYHPTIKSPNGVHDAVWIKGGGNVVRLNRFDAGKTASIWARSLPGDGEGQINLLYPTGSPTVTIDETWRRFEAPYGTHSNKDHIYAYDARAASSTLSQALICLPQVEVGAFASSPIEQYGINGTRAATSCTQTLASMGLPDLTTDFCGQLTWQLPTTAGALATAGGWPRGIALNSGGDDTFALTFDNGQLRVNFNLGGIWHNVDLGGADQTLLDVRFKYETGKVTGWLNGTRAESADAAFVPFAPLTTATLNGQADGQYVGFGIYKTVRLIPAALSDSIIESWPPDTTPAPDPGKTPEGLEEYLQDEGWAVSLDGDTYRFDIWPFTFTWAEAESNDYEPPSPPGPVRHDVDDYFDR